MSASPQSNDLHEMRMARFNEMVAASKQHGLAEMYMHLSALSPTTRKSHADRHGKLFTAQQVREFWDIPANAEGCKCSVLAILVDENSKAKRRD